MADMKRNFTGGKMNKDLDERLVPKGEYRDAMNIQVSTSEGSDVGTAQNILGNTLVLDPGDTAGTTQDFISQPAMKCVGKIVDEKNDAFYWFVTDEYTYINYNDFTSASPQGSNGAKKDMIIQYKDGFITPVFVAFGSYAWTQYNGVSWNSALQTITFSGTFGGVTGLVAGMNLQAAGPNSSYTPSSFLNTIASVDLTTNTITMVDPIDWMDNITTGYWAHNTKLFFGAGHLSTGTTATTLGFGIDYTITGINIIEDMLFWTDNNTEPKKINIPRSIQGTVNGITATQFINPERSIDVLAREEHITVIKKSPNAPPVLDLVSTMPLQTPKQSYAAFDDLVNNPGYLIGVGDTITIDVNHTLATLSLEGMVVGDVIVLEKYPDASASLSSDVVFPLRDAIIELRIDSVGSFSSAATPYVVGYVTPLTCTVFYVDPSVLLSEERYLVDRKADERGIFKFKYPRFATRYKYIDSEFSVFSPFTQPAFIPESWDYQTKKGENLGMQNVMREALLRNIIPTDIPDGVVQVDILYKESGSSNIYLVDKVRINDGTGNWSGNNYSIKSELIYSVVASNQILRPYDNVPRYALAQEVTGSRIVYGNYVQNYSSPEQEQNPEFNVSLASHSVNQVGTIVVDDRLGGFDELSPSIYDYPIPFSYQPSRVTPLRSIKSLREYQFGVVFEDKYGRQSPVMTGPSGAITVPKTESATANLIDITLNTIAPSWAQSFKFFVKETSPEYYNLAMDRWFDAEDGNVWLSFPSADRNKITDESTLVLKKSPEENIPDFGTSEYKVIAISNEVPDFVKGTKLSYGLTNQTPYDTLGTSIPIASTDVFYLSPYALQEVNSGIKNAIKDWNAEVSLSKVMYVRFHKSTTPNAISKYYRIASMDNYDFTTVATTSTPLIKVTISGTFGSDIDFMTNSGGGVVPGAGVSLSREVDINSSAYDGRFFAKIHKDISLASSIAEYTFSGGSTIVGTINPAFLHYKGWYHSSFDDADLHQNLSSASTGGVLNARSVATGLKTSAADNDWNTLTGNGSLSYTKSTRVSHGIGNQETEVDGSGDTVRVAEAGRITDEQLPGTASLTENTWGEDRYTTGPSGLDAGIDNIEYPGEAHFGRYPRPYPFMPNAYNNGGCLSAPQSNYFKNNMDRGGFFWHEHWYDNNGFGSNGWFIDMEPTAQYNEYDPVNYYNSYQNNPNIRGTKNTPGRGARLGNKFMDISYVGSDFGNSATNNSSPTSGWPHSGMSQANQDYHDLLSTLGNKIRFNNDPGQIEYEILAVRIVTGIKNTFYDGGCSTQLNWPQAWGNQGLYRVRYEIELDQPIGTTVQGQGIITPLEYVQAGGSGDNISFANEDCSNKNGAPVYAYKWNTSPLIPGNTPASNPAAVGNACDQRKGAFYDNAASPGYNNSRTIDSSVWVNTDGTTRLGFIPTQSYPLQTSTYDMHPYEIANGNQFTIDTAEISYAASDLNLSNSYGVQAPNEIHSVIPWNSTTFGQGETGTSANPAIWETLPETKVDIDLYFEASQSYPVSISSEIGAAESFIPVNSIIEDKVNVSTYVTFETRQNYNGATYSGVFSKVLGWNDGATLYFDNLPDVDPVAGDELRFTRTDGSYTTGIVSEYVAGTLEITLEDIVSGNNIGLSYYNCFAFGNGIESNRISDTFNSDTIAKGVRASTVLEEDYKEEHRKYGLIYSGLYNSMSGVNNLNQFIAAEKITKDINPIYGSIQKLHSRSTADGDLITLCEDRCLRILANKDALFNADGNSNVVATNRVLGQTIPFSGNYGISKNPESFASESYRVYFTDKVRGAVVRLSKDGLTAISDHGMKDFFKDHLKISDEIHGSFDDKKDEYNLVLKSNDSGEDKLPRTISFKESAKGWVSFKSFFPDAALSCANDYYTIEGGRLYLHHVTSNLLNDELVERNTFYNVFKDSTLTVILNESPGTVKTFHTVNYEGTESKIDQFTVDAATGLTDGEYYNLQAHTGWFVGNIFTDKEKGSINEFIEKEGKWFNYIKGNNVVTNADGVIVEPDGYSSWDQASFAIQGIGISNEVNPANVGGCTDPAAFNYDADAMFDDSSCVAVLNGCLQGSADNYYAAANTEDGSCIWPGCLDASAFNPTTFPVVADLYAIEWSTTPFVDDFSCIAVVLGCIDAAAFNYDPLANTDDGSCQPIVIGCIDATADNYDWGTTTDDGSCVWAGCNVTVAVNYGWNGWSLSGWPSNALTYVPLNSSYGIQDDGSCIGGGCMDDGVNPWTDASVGFSQNPQYPSFTDVDGIFRGPFPANNFDPTALFDPLSGTTNLYASCTWNSGCTRTWADNFDASVPVFYPYSVLSTCIVPGCMTMNALNYDCATSISAGSLVMCSDNVTVQDGSCVLPIVGCMNSTACNFNPNANVDDASTCDWVQCGGCMDTSSNNGNTQTFSNFPCTEYLPPLYQYNSANIAACTIPCGDDLGDPTGTANNCCTYDIYGCTDITALNYSPTANIDDGSCLYPAGCTNMSACNYDPDAITDDGTCSNANCTGCSDANAINYEFDTTIMSGPYAAGPTCNNNSVPIGCEYDCSGVSFQYGGNDFGCCEYSSVPGCTDITACNYDATALTDDGTCEYTSCIGCLDEFASNYNAIYLGGCNGTFDEYSTGFYDCCTF